MMSASIVPRIAPLLLLAVSGSVALVGCEVTRPGAGDGELERDTTEILWDEWGVPHLYAPDAESLFFAYGWAQARSHADLLLRLYGQARGRAAEYWGEEFVDSDRWVHTFGIPDRASRWYAAQEAPYRSYLDAFCRGINAYAEQHAEAVADRVEVVLPVTGRDVLAHLQRALHFTFLVSPEDLERQGLDPRTLGSNAWAISPNRTADERSILVANPHLPWSDLYTWHEAQLDSPEVRAYGATLVGWPLLAIAFNDRLGWSHTVNVHDGADLYELDLAADGYRFDGEIRPFETEEKVLRVKQGESSFRAEKLTLRRSLHGPVIFGEGGLAVALRVVGLDSPHLLRQYWEMLRARDLGEFEDALRQLQMPMFTVMYADADGRILHLFGGQTPVRRFGGWDDWQGIVDGSTSETLWNEVHPYDDLPRIRNPVTAWLQNANDPPWTTTVPSLLDRKRFPPYMSTQFMHFRAQRSASMLAEEEVWSFREVIDAKLSTRMALADRLLDDLDAAVRSGAGDDLAKEANEILQTWDREADAESRGAVLFWRFAELLASERPPGPWYQYPGPGTFAEDWSAADPLHTPDGLADPVAAVRLLTRAAKWVVERYGALDVPWGEVFRLRRGERDLPANGGPGSLGIFRVVRYEEDEDGRYRAVGGDSYQAVVEFSVPPRAVALLSYGNSSQPGSPHDGDQLELFARKEMRTVWLDRAEVEAHLEEREELAPRAVGRLDS